MPGSVDLSSQEVQMASHLIEAMAGPWNPAGDRDAHTDRVTSSSGILPAPVRKTARF